MLRGLAQSRGTSAELEAVTAERDFFREKYIEQVDEMEALKGKLKESQRVIDKLRSQILDLEVEKARVLEQATPSKTPKQIASSGGSTQTSVTCLTYDDDNMTKSSENSNEPAYEATDVSVTKEESMPSPGSVQGAGPEESEAGEVSSPKADECPPDAVSSDEEEEGSGSEDDDDEAEKIRAKAARMLLWANYQTSKRSTPNTSMMQEDDDDGSGDGLETPSKGVSNAIVYSLPTSLDKRQSLLDDDSTLGSTSRPNRPEPSVGSWRSGPTSPSGKMGKLFNSLRDMVDPQAESSAEDASDDESIDSSVN